MRKWTKSGLLLALIGLSTGCASQSEMEQRRENAFDLQGEYAASKRRGSHTDMLIRIENESGRHDVKAHITRVRPLEESERLFLKSKGILPESVAQHFGSQWTMDHDSSTLEGGDNISDDSGQSSRLQVCSAEYAYSQTQKVYFCIFATIRKSDYVLRGDLALRVLTTLSRENSAGHVVNTVSMDEKLTPFVASTQNMFYMQYMGKWTGKWWMNSAVSSTEPNLHLRPYVADSFEVLPSQTQIRMNGATYIYVAQVWPLATLQDLEVPTLEVVYRRMGAPDDERLVMFGQIYSLGNMTGSVVHIHNGNETQVGTFQLKRN